MEYWLHQDNDDPAEFTFYENWTNRAEWDKHMEQSHLAKFAEVARQSVRSAKAASDDDDQRSSQHKMTLGWRRAVCGA